MNSFILRAKQNLEVGFSPAPSSGLISESTHAASLTVEELLSFSKIHTVSPCLHVCGS